MGDASELIDEYLAAIPADDTQQVAADRIGITRSRWTKIVQARKEGEAVRLHDRTLHKLRSALSRLRGGDPIEKARQDGMREAATIFAGALVRVQQVSGLELAELIGDEASTLRDLLPDAGEAAKRAAYGRAVLRESDGKPDREPRKHNGR